MNGGAFSWIVATRPRTGAACTGGPPTFLDKNGVLTQPPSKKGAPMRLDRELQKRLLNALCDRYPIPMAAKDKVIDFRDPAVLRNLRYLQQHKLIALDFKASVDEQHAYATWAVATEEGMDFLEQDGGLSAILKVTTVRLHEDTIRQLIAQHITLSPLPSEKKESLLQRLKQLPAKSIERMADKLLDQALQKAPDAIEWISTLLGG